MTNKKIKTICVMCIYWKDHQSVIIDIANVYTLTVQTLEGSARFYTHHISCANTNRMALGRKTHLLCGFYYGCSGPLK